MVRQEGLEPPRLATPDPKSGVSAISPLTQQCKIGGTGGIRTLGRV